MEDDNVLAGALEIKFGIKGFTVYKAENGQQGLEIIQAQKPDIIILDLLMPVMDGSSMIRKLREIPEFSKTPVIVLTNAGNFDNMREMKLYYNVGEFLVKANVNPDLIVAKAENLLLPQKIDP